MKIKDLLITLYHHPVIERFFPTTVSCLKNSLSDCETILDLGCGADSPLQFCKNVKYSVGVETFKPYINISKKKKIHNKYINKRLLSVSFPSESFDAVVILEVIEHLKEKDGYTLLKKINKWAKKKIIISTPNGYIEQQEVDHNPFQKHLSGWNAKKLGKMGFKIFGLAGLKFLRTGRVHDTKDADLTSSIRFRPHLFWFVIAAISQLFTYRYPKFAFELFCVKNLKEY